MSKLREAAQQALEALEAADVDPHSSDAVYKAITALRAALAEPVQGCPSCEYNKQRAQLWRHEAYKLGGHPLDWEPELMVRPKPLETKQLEQIMGDCFEKDGLPENWWDWRIRDFARAIERAHGIGEKE